MGLEAGNGVRNLVLKDDGCGIKKAKRGDISLIIAVSATMEPRNRIAFVCVVMIKSVRKASCVRFA